MTYWPPKNILPLALDVTDCRHFAFSVTLLAHCYFRFLQTNQHTIVGQNLLRNAGAGIEAKPDPRNNLVGRICNRCIMKWMFVSSKFPSPVLCLVTLVKRLLIRLNHSVHERTPKSFQVIWNTLYAAIPDRKLGKPEDIWDIWEIWKIQEKKIRCEE